MSWKERRRLRRFRLAEEAARRDPEDQRAEAEYQKKMVDLQKLVFENGQMVRVKADGRIGCIERIAIEPEPLRDWVRTERTPRADAREIALRHIHNRPKCHVRFAGSQRQTRYEGSGQKTESYSKLEADSLFQWELEAMPADTTADAIPALVAEWTRLVRPSPMTD